MREREGEMSKNEKKTQFIRQKLSVDLVAARLRIFYVLVMLTFT